MSEVRSNRPAAADDLTIVLEAVRAAGALVESVDRHALEVREKSEGQRVSEADLAADDLLRQSLLSARPGYGWRSEESDARPGADPDAPVWVVDPIDGTDAYLSGNADYTVCVGQLRGGIPVLGVVMNPFAGELYYGVHEAGAFRMTDGDERFPVRAGLAGTAVPVVVVSATEEAAGVFADLSDWEVRVESGTAWKMLEVAAARADAFCTMATRYEWDTCAAEVICAEAGCQVTDSRGASIRYGIHDPAITGVMVGIPSRHERLLARMAPRLDRHQNETESCS